MKRILDVGQCNLDHGSIGGLLRDAFGAAVDRAHTAGEGLAAAKSSAYDLVLVNRVFDADGDSGLDFIKALKADAATKDTPVMLVSNFADAQASAVAAGALEGFGKSALSAAATKERLKAVLGVS